MKSWTEVGLSIKRVSRAIRETKNLSLEGKNQDIVRGKFAFSLRESW